jgi:hypothetical protein
LFTVSASIALPLLSVAPAYALTVTVDSIAYDVDVFIGKYLGNESLFQAPPAGKAPWWGDEILASTLAQIVYDHLGQGPTTNYGPVFAYDLSGGDILGIAQNLTDPLSQVYEIISNNSTVKYAIATPLASVPSSVPAPLPFLGATAAFGWSRQLRKRINGSKR